MKSGGPLRRFKRLTVDPGRYGADQRRRNTTLSTDPPPPDPAAAAFRAAVWARDGGRCTLAGHWGLACAGPLDVHHVIARLVAPELLTDPDNGTLLCRRHHDALQDHRFAGPAYVLGVLGRSGDRVRQGRVIT